MVIPTVGEGSEVDKVGRPTLMGRGSARARMRGRGNDAKTALRVIKETK